MQRKKSAIILDAAQEGRGLDEGRVGDRSPVQEFATGPLRGFQRRCARCPVVVLRGRQHSRVSVIILGGRRGVSPPVGRRTGGLTPRRSPAGGFLTTVSRSTRGSRPRTAPGSGGRPRST